jgi:hypothetical protein
MPRVVDRAESQLSLSGCATMGLNQSVALQIDWATPHSVRIKIGDSETHRVDVPWSINSVGISVSTGELEVDPLELGSISK